MPRLAVGDLAPDFTLPTADGGSVALSALRGGKVVLFFFPAAMTPGCTREACDFNESYATLQAAGYTVIGISPDSPATLAQFAAAEGLTYPLASDADRSVLEAYAAYGSKMLYGKEVVGVIRSTIVIGADGRVELPRYNVKATGHVASLRTALGLG
ncbi:peroxiredoxin [Actinotalea sp.]|uniref:peroxiredoxin n=1 Tax=Actinotalea sp. TaxID=1872145 RepID=UPI002BF6061B|nr:peroxiredoxin [Actinotalea sp.]HQY33498.1 peroxiredoxin [Actinotalea sp.]HRA49415.1 peroxiredoxin [Actinotalea sp.]